jgi:hypothetical protein
MALILGFLLSVLVILLAMFVAITVLNIARLLDYKYNRYIFKKYDIEEIKSEEDAKIFIKKLFKFYAEEKHNNYYVFSFKTEKDEEYEINKAGLMPFYVVDKFNALEKYSQKIYRKSDIKLLSSLIMQYSKECNDLIKSKRKKLLEMYLSFRYVIYMPYI